MGRPEVMRTFRRVASGEISATEGARLLTSEDAREIDRLRSALARAEALPMKVAELVRERMRRLALHRALNPALDPNASWRAAAEDIAGAITADDLSALLAPLLGQPPRETGAIEGLGLDLEKKEGAK